MSIGELNPALKDDPWRTRLLESLRDCGVQRVTGTRWGRWIVNVGLAMLLMTVTFIGRFVIQQINPSTDGDKFIFGVISVLWMLFVTFVIIRLRNRFVRQAWQSVARTAEEELINPRSRRPILYLRSFQLDDRIGKTSWLEFLLGTVPLANDEQQLTRELRKVGPVIAIGRPDEKLPPLGAARFYVSHDLWQKKVAEVAEESQLVLVATGTTEGLQWELSHLTTQVPAERLILWLHPHLLRISAAQREVEWQKFLAGPGKLFPKPLPSTLGEARFIFFTPNWEPVPVAPQAALIPSSRTRSAINALLTAKQTKIDPWQYAYRGIDTDQTFARAVGVMPQGIDWRRVGGFFAACVLMMWWGFITGSLLGPFLFAAATTVGVLAGYRYLPSFLVPLLVAVLCVLTRMTSPFWNASMLVTSFVSSFLMICTLNWATPRIAPRFAAFFFGALVASMGYRLLPLAMDGYSGPFFLYVVYSLIGDLLFAGCLALTVHFTEPQRKPVGL